MNSFKKGLGNLFLDYLPLMLFILFILLFFATRNIKTTLISFGLVFFLVVVYLTKKNIRSAKDNAKKALFDLFLDWLPVILFVLFALFWIVTMDAVVAAAIVGTIAVSLIVIIRRRRKKKLLKSGIEKVDRMRGEMFEELLLEHFKKLGYKARMTSSSADYGADLILEKPGERIAVQAKRWKGLVGVKAIQEAVAAMSYYNCNKAMIISNSYYTKNAQELAHSNNVELWDRNDLIVFLCKFPGKENVYESTERQDTLCPLCNSSLILRNGKYGKFLGCSNFPRCRYTESYLMKE